MTRPKGSLNKKRRPTPPVKEVEEKHQTVKDLKKVARERGVKLEKNSRQRDITEALGMESVVIPIRYDHCKERKTPQSVVKTNVDTGEKTKYPSIFKMSNSLGLFAGSVTYRIMTGKSATFDNITYTLSKE